MYSSGTILQLYQLMAKANLQTLEFIRDKDGTITITDIDHPAELILNYQRLADSIGKITCDKHDAVRYKLTDTHVSFENFDTHESYHWEIRKVA